MCGGVDYSVEISKDAQRRPGEQDRLTRRGPTKLSISFIFELGEKADRGIELFDLRNDPSLAFREQKPSVLSLAWSWQLIYKRCRSFRYGYRPQ
ncbi:hypothetical protein CGMCC3_g2496 [Colletotrichum fructicola]|nr:uncharacterized protein CGMCC3_g2496 [Colletotrichum fructicola]KAE9581290.1 hypothetical protein CGMCC3_g2496 [Colletotrichum fructicola]